MAEKRKTAPGAEANYSIRTVAILKALADGDELWSVTDLSKVLGIPQSSVHRALDHLVEMEFVERTPQRRYRIGTEYFRIAARVQTRFELVNAARPIMENVVARCGEICILGVLSPSRQRILVAHKVDSTQALRFRFPILDTISPIWGALGRATLAHLSLPDLHVILSQAEPSPVDQAPVPEVEQLRGELETIRRSGVAVTRGQRIAPDAIGVAAPFFEASGRVRGALGIVVPDIRFPEKSQSSWTQLIRTKAAEISHILGSRQHSGI